MGIKENNTIHLHNMKNENLQKHKNGQTLGQEKLIDGTMKRLHVNDNYVKSLRVSLAIQKITKEYTENQQRNGVKRIEQKKMKLKGNIL